VKDANPVFLLTETVWSGPASATGDWSGDGGGGAEEPIGPRDVSTATVPPRPLFGLPVKAVTCRV
jgi:hypothetical protein